MCIYNIVLVFVCVRLSSSKPLRFAAVRWSQSSSSSLLYATATHIFFLLACLPASLVFIIIIVITIVVVAIILFASFMCCYLFYKIRTIQFCMLSSCVWMCKFYFGWRFVDNFFFSRTSSPFIQQTFQRSLCIRFLRFNSLSFKYNKIAAEFDQQFSLSLVNIFGKFRSQSRILGGKWKE